MREIAAGLWHTVCTSVDGDVYSFGGNQFGQLGTGSDQAEVHFLMDDGLVILMSGFLICNSKQEFRQVIIIDVPLSCRLFQSWLKHHAWRIRTQGLFLVERGIVQ